VTPPSTPSGVLVTIVTGWDDDVRTAAFDRLAARLAGEGAVRTVTGPTVAPLLDLTAREPGARFGAVETTDPLASAAALCDAGPTASRTRLDAIVLVIDASRAAVRLLTGGPFAPDRRAAEWLAAADAVVPCGTEQLTATAADHVHQALRRRAPRAALVAPHRLAPGLGGFDLATVDARVRRATVERATAPDGRATTRIRVRGRFDQACAVEWLDLVANGSAGVVWRLEAVIPLHPGGALHAQAVGGHLECEIAPHRSWDDARVVMAGRDLDRTCLTRSLSGARVD